VARDRAADHYGRHELGVLPFKLRQQDSGEEGPPYASLRVPSGQMVASHCTELRDAPLTSASLRSAPVRFALLRFASLRFAPRRLTPVRFVLDHARMGQISTAQVQAAQIGEASLRHDEQGAGLYRPAPPLALNIKRSTVDSEIDGAESRGHAYRTDSADAEELGRPRNDQLRILRPAAAAKKLGVSKMTLYRWEESGRISPRLKLSAHCVGWEEGALDDFLRNRPAAREALPCPMPTRRNKIEPKSRAKESKPATA